VSPGTLDFTGLEGSLHLLGPFFAESSRFIFWKKNFLSSTLSFIENFLSHFNKFIISDFFVRFFLTKKTSATMNRAFRTRRRLLLSQDSGPWLPEGN